MKCFYLSIILILFCFISKGQQKNKILPPTGEILSLYKSHSVSKVFNYLKKHGFKLTNKNITGHAGALVHNNYYEKGDLSFWVSVSEKQSYDLSYYPTASANSIRVIADLVALRYKLVDSKKNEDAVMKSQCNSYHKDGVFVEVDSFYNKIKNAATYSVIISDRTFL